MKPGATTRPFASKVVLPLIGVAEIAAIFPFRIPTNRVASRLGIDDAPVGDHDVVLRLLRMGDCPRRQEHGQHHRESAHRISIFLVSDRSAANHSRGASE